MKSKNIYSLFLSLVLLCSILLSSCNIPFLNTTATTTSDSTTTTTTAPKKPEVINMLLSELINKENVEFIIAIEKKHFLDETFSPIPEENMLAFLDYFCTNTKVTTDPNTVYFHSNGVGYDCYEGRGLIINIKYKDEDMMDNIYINFDGKFYYSDCYILSNGSYGSQDYVFSEDIQVDYATIKALLGVR